MTARIPSLSEIEALLATAETGSVRAAADRLALSLSAVSRRRSRRTAQRLISISSTHASRNAFTNEARMAPATQ